MGKEAFERILLHLEHELKNKCVQEEAVHRSRFEELDRRLERDDAREKALRVRNKGSAQLVASEASSRCMLNGIIHRVRSKMHEA